MLSYLKNNDGEDLLKDFIIFNDGTESFSPNKSAIDTLNKILDDFSDEKLNNKVEPTKSIIIAINLGVLNNFIDSEYGERYGLLRSYVYKKEILTSNTNTEIISNDSYFQSINFSDYHLFNLKKDGINVVFMDKMMDKIFGEFEDNPFYQKYKTECCDRCVWESSCPVKHNFEFLKNKKCQSFISGMLVECIIKDKLILTAREFQNFLYDIVVPTDFDPSLTFTKPDIKKRLDVYIKSITPFLMFEQKDSSPLMNIVKNTDPVTIRSEKTDEEAINFYAMASITNDIQREFSSLPYGKFFLDEQVINKISDDKTYRSRLFSVIRRCQSFFSSDFLNEDYRQFLKYLYYFNTNNIIKLDYLYVQVEAAVKQWCGTDNDDNLCIETNKLGYRLYEEVNFEVYDEALEVIQDNELSRFTNHICVKFESKNKKDISLEIDYNLFELITKLNNGYIQTFEDRNNHAGFLTFIQKIKKNGNSSKKVIVKSPNGVEVIFQKKKLGYTYKSKEGS